MFKHLSLRLSLVLSICLIPFTSFSELSIPTKPSAERYISTGGNNGGDCAAISCKTIQYAVKRPALMTRFMSRQALISRLALQWIGI